jgi:hypothetical protein
MFTFSVDSERMTVGVYCHGDYIQVAQRVGIFPVRKSKSCVPYGVTETKILTDLKRIYGSQ